MSGHEPDDGILLRRITAGDSDALLALHKRYANLVHSMAWRVLQYSEMAQLLALPLGTVKGRLRLGLERLRSLWLEDSSE